MWFIPIALLAATVLLWSAQTAAAHHCNAFNAKYGGLRAAIVERFQQEPRLSEEEEQRALKIMHDAGTFYFQCEKEHGNLAWVGPSEEAGGVADVPIPRSRPNQASAP